MNCILFLHNKPIPNRNIKYISLYMRTIELILPDGRFLEKHKKPAQVAQCRPG